MHKLAIIFILAVLSTSCATYGNYSGKAMNLQMGMSKEQVFAMMGQPKKAAARTEDGKMVERFSWWSPKVVGFTPIDNEMLSSDRIFVEFKDGKVTEWGDNYDFGATTARTVEAQTEMMKAMQQHYKQPAPPASK